jgi:hypothetical protein
LIDFDCTGITWQRVPGASRVNTSDEQNLSFDNRTGEWIYTVKRFAGKLGRSVAIATTKDFYSERFPQIPSQTAFQALV